MNLWPFFRPKPAPVRYVYATKADDSAAARRRKSTRAALERVVAQMTPEQRRKAREAGATVVLESPFQRGVKRGMFAGLGGKTETVE